MATTVAERTRTGRRIVASMRVGQPAVARPPGPGGLQAAARLMSGSQAPHQFFAGLAEWHQPVVHLKLARDHVNVLFSPEAIWRIFVTEGRHTRKDQVLQMTRPLLGDGLLTSDGHAHMRHRRVIQPLFHPTRIDTYVSQMVAAAEVTSRQWSPGLRIDLPQQMAALTLDVIGRTIFGEDLRTESVVFGSALSTVLDAFARGPGPLSNPLSRVPTPRRRREVAAIESLDGTVNELIAERRRAVANGSVSGDLLTLLLTTTDENGEPAFNHAQVRDEAMTLVLAGHETTALALTWTFHLLSHNPSARNWLEAELDALDQRAVTAADLPRLPRTYAIVAETMRLYPPAWIVGRWLEQDLRVTSWDLPRGSVVLASQFAMHRDARFWPGALEFRPQRWLDGDGRFDERVPGVPRGVWFPFGFGSRRCIGEHFAWTEAVVTLATLARRWRVAVDGPADPPARSAITLRPARPMTATIQRRSA